MITSQLAEAVGKDISTICYSCRQHNIELGSSKNFITDEEKEFIFNNIVKTVKEIAEKLSHSQSSIHYFCERNDIKLKTNRNNLTDKENWYIEADATSMKSREIAKSLGMTETTRRNYYKGKLCKSMM